jgi:hypothetical protein
MTKLALSPRDCCKPLANKYDLSLYAAHLKMPKHAAPYQYERAQNYGGVAVTRSDVLKDPIELYARSHLENILNEGCYRMMPPNFASLCQHVHPARDQFRNWNYSRAIASHIAVSTPSRKYGEGKRMSCEDT